MEASVAGFSVSYSWFDKLILYRQICVLLSCSKGLDPVRPKKGQWKSSENRRFDCESFCAEVMYLKQTHQVSALKTASEKSMANRVQHVAGKNHDLRHAERSSAADLLKTKVGCRRGSDSEFRASVIPEGLYQLPNVIVVFCRYK